MELYLMRHGEAEAYACSGRDADRSLTPSGIEQVTEVGMCLRSQHFKVDLICASPYVRAAQTADLIAREIHYPGHVENLNSLAPSGSVEETCSDLEHWRHRDRILLVGHMPHMAELLFFLMKDSKHAPAAFHKAAIACIVLKQLGQPGTLRWYRTPVDLIKQTVRS